MVRSIFPDAAAAFAFKEDLMLFAACVDAGEGGVSNAGWALNSILQEHGPDDAAATDALCPGCHTVYPCKTTLVAVSRLHFPFGWDVVTTAVAVEASGKVPVDATLSYSAEQICLSWWDFYDWRRVDERNWSFTLSMRGGPKDLALKADEVPAHFLSTMVGKSYPFPYSWRIEKQRLADAENLARSSRRAWNELKANPFLEEWR